jgi:hypothetical protein
MVTKEMPLCFQEKPTKVSVKALLLGPPVTFSKMFKQQVLDEFNNFLLRILYFLFATVR